MYIDKHGRKSKIVAIRMPIDLYDQINQKTLEEENGGAVSRTVVAILRKYFA